MNKEQLIKILQSVECDELYYVNIEFIKKADSESNGIEIRYNC